MHVSVHVGAAWKEDIISLRGVRHAQARPGAWARGYLSEIRAALGALNDAFENLGVRGQVPLPGHPDEKLEYEELLGYERAGRAEIFVGKLGEEFSVRKLIDGIEPPSAPPESRVIQVQNYFESSPGSVEITHMEDSAVDKYQAHAAERAATFGTAIAFVVLIGFLVVRNEPIADQNMVVFLRILLSTFSAVLGASIPGFLHVDIKGKGFAIRAAGALAMFVMTFWLTPNVMPIQAAVP